MKKGFLKTTALSAAVLSLALAAQPANAGFGESVFSLVKSAVSFVGLEPGFGEAAKAFQSVCHAAGLDAAKDWNDVFEETLDAPDASQGIQRFANKLLKTIQNHLNEAY